MLEYSLEKRNSVAHWVTQISAMEMVHHFLIVDVLIVL